MWRCKDKLRKAGILVTEDSTARLAKAKEEKKVKEKQSKEDKQKEEERLEKEMYEELDLGFLL